MGKRYRDIVRQYSQAKRGTRAVMNLLADYATDENGEAWPGHQRLAAESGLSERTVTRAITALIEAGEIELIEPSRQHKEPRYRILLTEQGRQIDHARVDNVTARVDNVTARVDNVTSTYMEEPQEPNKRTAVEPEGGICASVRDLPRQQNSPNPLDYFDPSKLVNGRMPPGSGANPIEAYLESYSIDEIRHRRVTFDPVMRDELIAQVTNLDRWREIVRAWKLSGFKADNWSGQLDWYRNGVNPGGKRNGSYRQNGNGSGRPTANGVGGGGGNPAPDNAPDGLDAAEVEELRRAVRIAHGKPVDDAGGTT